MSAQELITALALVTYRNKQADMQVVTDDGDIRPPEKPDDRAPEGAVLQFTINGQMIYLCATTKGTP